MTPPNLVPDTAHQDPPRTRGAPWRRWPRPSGPALTALAYAFFGLAWVLLSDRLMQLVAPDVATLSAVGLGKGVAFILVTSGLIYLVAARHAPAGPRVEASRGEERDALPWVFGLLAAAIVLASLVSYATAAHRAHEQQVGQLRQEAELKAGIVQGWIDQRAEEAGQLTGDALLRDSLLRWRRTGSEASAQALRRYLKTLASAGRYADAVLVDGSAALLLAPDGAARRFGPELSRGVQRAFARGAPESTDFYTADGDAPNLHMDLMVPLAGADGHPDAVLVLRTAPRTQLLPQLLMRATSGAPETLLLYPSPTGVLAFGIGGSDAAQQRPAPARKPSLADLAGRASLAGSLLGGLDDGSGEARLAVAAAVRRSGWYVAVQTPRDRIDDAFWSGAAALAVTDVLALLAAGGVLYTAQRRREHRATSRVAEHREEGVRAWKIAEAIANCSSDAIFAKDLQGRYLFVNREMCRIAGRSAEELVGKDLSDRVPKEQMHRFLQDDAAVLRADKPVCVELRLATPEGERIHACTKGRLLDDEGRTIGVYGVSSDITERRDLQQRMRQWATAFEDVRDGVVIADSLGRVQAVNRAFTTITGYAADEAIGSGLNLLKSGRHGPDFYRQMWAAINADGHWQGEIWNRRKSGEIYPEWLTISAVRDDHDGAVTNYVGVFTDISRLKHSEAQNDWLVNHDPLTRLPNRLHLQRRLEEALARSRRHETRAVLLVIDLDGFKTVNDSLGHPAGDEVLVCIAKRLQARLRHEDFLGRLGGDEFLVIVEAPTEGCAIDTLARDLLAAVSAPVALSVGQDAYLTASIGISMFPEDGSPTAVELLRDADAAMYRAKEMGRNCFSFYTGDMNASAMAKLELEAALSRAIERDELRLFYQPKVDARSGAIIGAEALLRWERGGAGLVAPAQFIPMAENSSLILDIGAWVIDAVCLQLRHWMDAGLPIVRIAVNVAARQFAAGDLDVVVARALERHDVPADCLELELTEGMLISNPQEGTQMLQRLRNLGVKVSLDDFGTGYSSLAYLHQFPIDALKIDQSFVKRIGEVPDGAALVDAVIGLAHRLRLRVVAEGVETSTQRDHLRRQGCDEMQGYHFGRPEPAAALQAQLTAQRGALLGA
ncbi:EAL domain-containing protein [Pelomonas sp. P7]|uniref:EAL domain-containing protein n=1 Tax=Pelomonas caseinilytica TaxID=2906763 RepID=A0ABS8XGH0_9BURK|nr:EAL domain-containing protein [Pelomonas sp. P7]MCE4538077.1 EAL domain-containing protein [Pelomonas sp. P7]